MPNCNHQTCLWAEQHETKLLKPKVERRNSENRKENLFIQSGMKKWNDGQSTDSETCVCVCVCVCVCGDESLTELGTGSLKPTLSS